MTPNFSHLSALPSYAEEDANRAEVRTKGRDFAQTLQDIGVNLAVSYPTPTGLHLSISLELFALLLAESVSEHTEHEVPALLEALQAHLLGGAVNDKLATLVAHRHAMLTPSATLAEIDRLSV